MSFSVSASALVRLRGLLSGLDCSGFGLTFVHSACACKDMKYHLSIVRDSVSQVQGQPWQGEVFVPSKADIVIDLGDGLCIYLDHKYAVYLKNVYMDYIFADLGQRFVFENPDVFKLCGCGQTVSFSQKNYVDACMKT